MISFRTVRAESRIYSELAARGRAVTQRCEFSFDRRTKTDPPPVFENAPLLQQPGPGTDGRSEPSLANKRRPGQYSSSSMIGFFAVFAAVITILETSTTTTKKEAIDSQIPSFEDPSQTIAYVPQEDLSTVKHQPRQADAFNRYQHHRTPWVLKQMASASEPQNLNAKSRSQPQSTPSQRPAVTKGMTQPPMTAQERQEMERFNDSRKLARRYGEPNDETARGRQPERQLPTVRQRSQSTMSAASASSFDTNFSSVGGFDDH